MVKITKKLNELKVKLHGNENPAYALLEEDDCFEKKTFILLKTRRAVNYFISKNLKNIYHDKTVNMNHFSITINKMKDGFTERFEQLKRNASTLTFIVDSLNTKTNEINFELCDQRVQCLRDIANADAEFSRDGPVNLELYFGFARDKR